MDILSNQMITVRFPQRYLWLSTVPPVRICLIRSWMFNFVRQIPRSMPNQSHICLQWDCHDIKALCLRPFCGWYRGCWYDRSAIGPRQWYEPSHWAGETVKLMLIARNILHH